jgi:hypothetical protein
MPDYEKKIKVHYRADHTPQIWFTPNDGDVDMDATGKIIFEKSDDSNDFTFSGFTITPTSPDFSLDSILDDKMTVLDSDADAGTYEYCISLDTANGTVSSDPQIINKPE